MMTTDARSSLIIIGDSWTEGAPGNLINNPTDAQDKFTISARIRDVLKIPVHNKGVSGNTTSQMLARFSTDVLSYAPTHCIIQGWGNDISDVNNFPPTLTQSNLQSMVQACQGNNIVPILVNPPPLEQSLWIKQQQSNPAATLARFNAIRPWLIDYCQQNNILLLDWDTPFEGRNLNLAYAKIFYAASDLHHLNKTGYRAVGDITIDFLRNILPEYIGSWSRADSDMHTDYLPGKAYTPNTLIRYSDSFDTSAALAQFNQIQNSWVNIAYARHQDALSPTNINFFDANAPDLTDPLMPSYVHKGDISCSVNNANKTMAIYQVTTSGWGSKTQNTPKATWKLWGAVRLV